MKVNFENCEVEIHSLKTGCVVEYMSNFYHLSSLGVFEHTVGNIGKMPLQVTNQVHPTGRWLHSDNVTWLEPH